jgi:hypothetical protein
LRWPDQVISELRVEARIQRIERRHVRQRENARRFTLRAVVLHDELRCHPVQAPAVARAPELSDAQLCQGTSIGYRADFSESKIERR